MVFIMSHLIFGTLCEYQCTWRKKFDVSHQIIALNLLIGICQETNSRKQMIVHILFDKIKYVLLFYFCLFYCTTFYEKKIKYFLIIQIISMYTVYSNFK